MRRLFLLVLLLPGVFIVGQGETGGDDTLRRIHLPILMYHYVSPLPPDADRYRVELTVEPDVFRAHMQYLKQAGYTTVSLYNLYDALVNGSPLPEKPVVLTFDDGYIDHYAEVYPVLQAFGFTGTFFVVTDRVDSGDPNYASWAQLREMAENGMSIEAHTKTHRDLRGRDNDFLVYEIVGSMESVSAHMGLPRRMFSYPAGRYDAQTLAVVRSAPIWMAVTTRNGAYHTRSDLHELPRLRVSGNMGVPGLEQLLKASR